jgi:hypothetical protein
MLIEGMHPSFAPVVAVADPHAIFRDADLQLRLTQRGYTILPYEDPIVFRLAYEAQYAPSVAAEPPPMVVVLWQPDPALHTLPADLLARSVPRHVSLADLFPNLHLPILAELDSLRLDRLWTAYGQQRGSMQSASATAEIVLQAGYSISLTALQTPADALDVLLTIHFAAQPLPPFLATVLQQQLAAIPELAAWPLAAMLHDRAALDAFLAQAWPHFLHARGYLAPADITTDSDAATDAATQSLAINEPGSGYHTTPLPFDDPHIWPAIDTLFLAGRLHPIPVTDISRIPADFAIGVKQSDRAYAPLQRERLTDQLRTQCPDPTAPAAEWLTLAPLIAEFLRLASSSSAPDPQVTATLNNLQASFSTWMQQRYATLQNTAPLPRPHLVSHLPHLLARERMQAHQPVRHALLVLDGLALDQWLVLRDTWQAQGYDFTWDERALFAWVPTLTSISRQAIFAAAPPTRFATSLERTDREAAHWQRFWQEQGLQSQSIAYRRGLHGFAPKQSAADLAVLDELLTDPRIQVIGLVIDAVDRIAHGMQQGEAGMLQQVRQWADNRWCAEVITRLRDAGFRVTLTADHGNCAAHGIGRLQDGILAEEAGQRTRIYSDDTLRDRILADHPDLIAWEGSGLPAGLAVVLAPTAQAFVPVGQHIVTHGGINLREVLVPWCVLH